MENTQKKKLKDMEETMRKVIMPLMRVLRRNRDNKSKTMLEDNGWEFSSAMEDGSSDSLNALSHKQDRTKFIPKYNIIKPEYLIAIMILIAARQKR